ncbi:hypothetical protein CC79DRAFT_1366159 [Sarocladium strictum]
MVLQVVSLFFNLTLTSNHNVALALREHWDAPTCPALKALQGLGDSLGVIVKCQPEWPIIVNDLRPVYDERGVDLVASVAGLVRSVCEAVCELVDDNGDETWGDTLLEKLGESFRTLKIFPEVSSGSLDRPQARWDDERGGITLDLPKTAIATPLEFIPIFKEELRTTFDEKPASSQVQDEEDAVIVDSATTPLKDLSINPQPRPAVVQYLPDASLIPRPDELLQRPPYLLHVRASGDHRVDIECTHSPSLQVLATYLKRWCRTNHNLSTKVRVVHQKIPLTLLQWSRIMILTKEGVTASCGGHQGRFHVSPTLVLHLVESVLGYERVHTDICSWQFRRDTAFKTV